MSDKEKPIQTPFDKTVPSLSERQGSGAPGEDRICEDLSLGDDGLSDSPKGDDEPGFVDQDDQEAYVEDYDSKT